MKVNKLIKRYETFIGEKKFMLRNLVDLQYIHDIDYKEISGIDTLTEEDLTTVKVFLVNFFNAWGLETRALIQPIRVHSVLERSWWIKNPKENVRIYIKTEHIAIDSTGKVLFNIYERTDRRQLHLLDQAQKQEHIYMRFEYSRGNGVEWLHVEYGGYGWY